VLFGWMGITWYMRTLTYKERARDYVMAARAQGEHPAHHLPPHSA
jgi:microcin C transport system permease protein